MDLYKGAIPILDADHPTAEAKDALFHHPTSAFGCVPRDLAVDPYSMRADPTGIDLLPESEYDARYDLEEELKSSLEHLYLPNGPDGAPAFVNLNQGSDGHCWAYDPAHAIMLCRLRDKLPLVRLNPHSIAVIAGRVGAREGGWCGLSTKMMSEIGCAVEGTGPGQWPARSNDPRHYTEACKAEMAKYRIEESWFDAAREVWDQRLNERMLRTCNFNNVPTPTDYNWWGHSVVRIRTVRIERGSWGALILNSWLNWGRHGLAVLRGSQATANGATAVRTVTVSA